MNLRNYIVLVIKGIGMGTANIIPGVSGGTIALITGIFERLINAIKSFNLTALKLLISGRLRAFIEHTDLKFLIALFAGIFLAIISLAKLLDYLFINYPVFVWSYFFGLILASVYFVGRTIDRWKLSVIISLLVGAGIALAIGFLAPATENDHFLYLIVCGVVAVCSMILPGISGSFVLVLMGNYQLVMIDAINNVDIKILLPVVIGAAVGLLGFSHLLSWIFRKFRNETISLLTGFIFGSLVILWPWKNNIYMTDQLGNVVLKKGEPIVSGYHRYIPETFNVEVIIAIVIVILGIASIWITEKFAEKKAG